MQTLMRSKAVLDEIIDAEDQLREAIRAVIRKELAEVQPAVAPTKPSPGPTIHPGKPIS